MVLDFVYTRNKSAKVLTESSFLHPFRTKIWYLGGNGISQIHADVSKITTDTTLQLCMTAQDIYMFVYPTHLKCKCTPLFR